MSYSIKLNADILNPRCQRDYYSAKIFPDLIFTDSIQDSKAFITVSQYTKSAIVL